MRIRPFLLAAGIILAGCNGDGPAKPEVTVGLITPGVWKVDAPTDYMLVWIHNEVAGTTQVMWNVTMADGTPLPAGWASKSTLASAWLQPKGSKVTNPAGRVSYPDWTWSRLSLDVPPDTAPADHALRINAGPLAYPFTLKINSTAARVSKPGDNVEVRYDGTFNATGVRFDDGEFPTKLGSGQTVPGFDSGLMGLALDEKAVLIIPPALAYGYDNTDPGYTKFNGQTLRFDVSIIKFT